LEVHALPRCQAAQEDVEKLHEYIEFAKNREPSAPGLDDAKKLVKIAADEIKRNLRSDSYMKAPQNVRCCHPHFADLESQVDSLRWPRDMDAVRDDLIKEIRGAYQRALNNSEYC
jgi:hypothetical protein